MEKLNFRQIASILGLSLFLQKITVFCSSCTLTLNQLPSAMTEITFLIAVPSYFWPRKTEVCYCLGAKKQGDESGFLIDAS